MNNEKPIRTLKAIPRALFDDFGNPKTLKSSSKTDGEDRLSISIAKVSDDSFPAARLAYLEFTCAIGKYHRHEIQLYDQEVEFGMFDLLGENKQISPLLTISVGAAHPSPNSDAKDADWMEGKGFWILEYMTISLGGEFDVYTVNMMGLAEDILHFFLLSRIQDRAYKHGLGVSVFGHWEREWNPKGEYKVRPEKF